MAQEPWKNDKWFVSPWNFTDEISKQLHFPKQIKIHDITLRDGEQQTGVIFTKDDKIKIAEKLAEAGVHRIEAGMPVVSPSDEAAIKEIVAANPKQVEAYKAKPTMMGWFVGQVMKSTGGKANPKIVNELLKKALDG